MDGYVGFHAALRHAYIRFLKDLAKQCKQLLRHHLDSVTSPYSLVCYENDFEGGSFQKINRAPAGLFSFELSDSGAVSHDETMKDQENIPPERNIQQITPGKGTESREALRECQITVPETPSPEQPCDAGYGVKKEFGNGMDIGVRKRASRVTRTSNRISGQDGGGTLFGNGDGSSRYSSAYKEICSSAAQHFARIREVLIERSVMSTLNSGFLTPW